MLVSVKRMSSLLPEAKQSIPRREAEVTVQQVTSHCISRCIVVPCGAPGWIRRRTSHIRCTDSSVDQVAALISFGRRRLVERLCFVCTLIASKSRHWRPLWIHRRELLGRKRREGRRGIDHVSAGDRQYRFDGADLFLRNGEIVRREDGEVGILVWSDPALDVLLTTEPGTSERVEP